jgi:hypothetical protein
MRLIPDPPPAVQHQPGCRCWALPMELACAQGRCSAVTAPWRFLSTALPASSIKLAGSLAENDRGKVPSRVCGAPTLPHLRQAREAKHEDLQPVRAFGGVGWVPKWGRVV